MTMYADMVLICAVTVFVVDISGWTESWKAALGRWLHIRVGRVRPFDCSLCMTWWLCLLYLLCAGGISFPSVAFSALLAALSRVVAQLYRLLVYALETAVSALLAGCDWIMDKLHK